MLSHLELRLIGEVMLRNFNASGAQPTTQKFAGDKWEHHLQCNILSYAEFVSVFLQLRGAHPAMALGSVCRWLCRQTDSMHA